jgi:organic radical activating enzyme
MSDTYCQRAENELIINAFGNNIKAALCCKSQDLVDLDETELQKIRDDLNRGVKNKHCNICWFHERTGIRSWRQIGNEEKVKYKTIELYLNNLCDSSCVYCSHKFSTKWQQEISYMNDSDQQIIKGLINDISFETSHDKKHHLIHILEYISKYARQTGDHPVQIAVLGGEPLLTPFIKKNIIDDIIDAFYSVSSEKRLFKILIVTNGNTPDNIIDKTLEIIEIKKQKHPNLTFSISISMESTKSIAEYVRYGVKWNQFDKNFKKWLNSNNEINISLTANIVSFFDIPKFIDYVFNEAEQADSLISLRFNLALYPEHLSIALLDKKYFYVFEEIKSVVNKNKFNFHSIWRYFELLEQLKVAENVFSTQSNNIKIKENAVTYFNLLERTRKIKLQTVNQELANYLGII